MKSSHSLLKAVFPVLLLIAIAMGLINSEYFYSPTAAAYYGFCISALLFTVASSAFYLAKNNPFKLKTPTLVFGLWCLYSLFHHITNTGTLVFTLYSLVLYFLFLNATTLFSLPDFNFKLFFPGIAIIASLESIYCVAQFLGWTKCQNELYTATGSWNNPNVTAIFLALATPVFLYLFKEKYKKVILSGFLIVLIALVLLKCRAAFVGTALSAVVFYALEYDFLDWIKDKKNRSSVRALFILVFLIVIPVSSHLYNSKKASADGRKFIWKLSAQMATEKPVTGYGYGFFEKEYNLHQAGYIKSGKATAEELANAGAVIMPHNEILLNVVEGGIIGILLMVFFFGSLLLSIKNRKKPAVEKTDSETAKHIKNGVFNLSYAGTIAFIGMSMVNSTSQIVPIMSLFMFYGAIISSTLSPIKLSPYFFLFEKNGAFSRLVTASIALGSTCLLYVLFGMLSADSQNKKAALLKKERQYEKALQIMPQLAKNIDYYSDYWKNYGAIYMETRQYSKALYCLGEAKKWSALPELYHGCGYCYEKLHQYPQAIAQYETLIALHPSKFLYRMNLLQAYLKNKETTEAIVLAKEIIQMKPRIPSEKVNRYKSICRNLLRKLGIDKINTTKPVFQKQSPLNFK